MRWSNTLPVVFVATFLLAAVPAQALYEDMTFTPVITDGEGDAAGFNDIVEIALGEPGDETIVVRIKPASFSPAPPAAAASIDYFVGDLRISFRPDATHTAEYDSCTIEGDYGYCILPYDALDLSVGDEVPAGYAISYLGSAVDCAPDTTPGTACALTVGEGLAYVLQGCTALSCMGGGTPEILYSHVTTTDLKVTQAFSSTSNATYQYNWTTNATALQFRAAANVTSGHANVTIVDGANLTVVNETFAADANRTLDLEGSPGNWTIQVVYSNFTGSLDLSLQAPPPPAPTEAPSTNTTTPNDDTRTGTFPLQKDDKGSPGLGVVFLGLALVAVALLERRRIG